MTDTPSTTELGQSAERAPLVMEKMTNEQIALLKQIWEDVKASDSQTPMADLRSRMTESGRFDFIDQFSTNNIELRQLVTESESADAIIRERRHVELRAIVAATEGKNTEVECLRALQEAGILPEGSGIRMSGREIIEFVQSARRELAELEASPVPTSEPDPGPTNSIPEELDISPLKVVALDVSVDLRQAAIDFANQRLTSELNSEAGFFKRMTRRIWKGNIARDYFRAKYAREAEAEMVQRGNFLGGDVTPEQLADARRALFNRFGMEFDEAIHDEAGEQRNTLDNTSDFALKGRDLIRQYVERGESDFNKDALQQELNRLIKEQSEGESPVIPGGDILKVNNLMEIAEQVKARIAHGQAMDNVLGNIQFITGEARTGVRTGLKEATVEKLYQKMEKFRNQRLICISPEMLLVVAGAATMVSGFGAKRLISTALTLVPGAGGAIVAGWRENVRTKEDRIQHMREMAQGGTISEGDTQREEMEGARYEARRASDLTEALGMLSAELTEGSDRKAALEAALRGLGDINARIQVGDASGKDLISFSDQANIGIERLQLDIARAQLRAQIDGVLQAMTPDERLGYGADDGSARDLAALRSEEVLGFLDQDIKSKDEVFKKLKRKRVLGSAAVGFGVGLTYGLAGQEIFATLSDTRQGLVEGLWNSGATSAGSAGEIHQTLLQSWINGEKDVIIPSAYGGNLAMTSLAPGGGNVLTPEGMSFKPDGAGRFLLVDKGGGEVLREIALTQDGQLDSASLAQLHEKGFTVSEAPRTFTIPGVDTTKTVTYNNPGDYVKNNGGVEISGKTWADNGTRTPDKNELRFWGMGVRQDGTIDYSIHTMTGDGSRGQGPDVNWREEADAGRLTALVSGSRGTQNYAFQIPIGTDGKFTIPPDHPAHKFFDVKPGEDWEAGKNFNGGFVEIAKITPNADGSIQAHMLATEVGRDSQSSITETILTPGVPETHTVFDYEVKPPSDEVIPVHTEIAPTIPITGRRSLERLRRNIPTPYPYYGEGDREDPHYSDERSPRLIDDSRRMLDPEEELNWFESRLTQDSPERVDRILDDIRQDAVLSHLPADLKGIVTIPVAAIHEGDNIYHTLERYAKTNNKDIDKTVILINLNWVGDSLNDPNNVLKIQKTRDEIQRVRQDYPDLKISVVEREYNAVQFRKTRGAIGYVAKDLYDTALVALNRAVSAKTIVYPQDVAIVRNDADTKRMSQNYLDKIYKQVSENQATDIFQGATRHGLGVSGEYPGFSILTNFDAALHMAAAKRGDSYTGNHNYAIRASSLAAVGGIGIRELEYTGAGSDDVEIARRIKSARGVAMGVEGGIYGVHRPSSSESTVTRHLYGATIESDPARMLRTYVNNNGDITSTWSDFSDSEEGYSGRSGTVGNRETVNESLSRLEHGVTSIIRNHNVNDGDLRRTLTLLFDVGLGGRGYTLSTDSDGAPKFKLNGRGRRAIIRLLEQVGSSSYYKKRADTVASRMA